MGPDWTQLGPLQLQNLSSRLQERAPAFPEFFVSTFHTALGFFWTELKRFDLCGDKTGVPDGGAEHRGDRRSPRAADWASLLDLAVHLHKTLSKASKLTTRQLQGESGLFVAALYFDHDSAHLAFVQLSPCKMGKGHLDCFALDPVNKSIAHWAEPK